MRVLVVDDSTLFRKVVRDVLREVPDVEIVGVAANGKIALEKIEQLKPDLLTLDVEMPELDGLGVLRALRGKPSPPSAIMLSSLTDDGAEKTTEALELGAFDFVLKPTGSNLAENEEQLQRDLIPRVAAFRSSRRKAVVAASSVVPEHAVAAERSVAAQRTVAGKHPVGAHSTSRIDFDCPSILPPKVCLVGVSTGGPAALAKLLPRISGDFPLPIIVVQHMPAVFTRKLAETLDEDCRLKVHEIEDGMSVQSGNIYVAPGAKQTQVIAGLPHPMFRVNDDPPEKHCKPSVDYLFRSAIEVYGSRTMGVILTGMGNDGTEGCRLIKARGGTVIAQDEASCVVYGMPRSVAESGLADLVAPIDKIADAIQQTQEQALCR